MTVIASQYPNPASVTEAHNCDASPYYFALKRADVRGDFMKPVKAYLHLSWIDVSTATHKTTNNLLDF